MSQKRPTNTPDDGSLSSARAILDCPGGGRIVTMGFPGLAVSVDGTSYLEPERLNATLDDLESNKTSVLVALAETKEFGEEHWSGVTDALSARNIQLGHMPIEDFAAPDDDFMHAWTKRSLDFHALLDQDLALGLTCHYGAGRSGTIAAYVLIERGLTPQQAITQVRGGFDKSIESVVQVDWLYDSVANRPERSTSRLGRS